MDETGKPTKHTRRTALRTWLTGSALLTLLAMAGTLPIRSILAAPAARSARPAPAQVPAGSRFRQSTLAGIEGGRSTFT
jgi:hypothetical protein